MTRHVALAGDTRAKKNAVIAKAISKSNIERDAMFEWALASPTGETPCPGIQQCAAWCLP
jgi:hypothetical protein